MQHVGSCGQCVGSQEQRMGSQEYCINMTMMTWVIFSLSKYQIYNDTYVFKLMYLYI